MTQFVFPKDLVKHATLHVFFFSHALSYVCPFNSRLFQLATFCFSFQGLSGHLDFYSKFKPPSFQGLRTFVSPINHLVSRYWFLYFLPFKPSTFICFPLFPVNNSQAIVVYFFFYFKPFYKVGHVETTRALLGISTDFFDSNGEN